MSSITIDTSDLDPLFARCANALPIVERHFGNAMVRSTAAVQHDAMVLVPVDTGHLRRSITTDVTPFVGRVGTNVAYARPVEEGRRPGAPMPPRGVLLEWMRRHDIPAAAEFLVRRSIARKGIKARPYLIPALERNEEGIRREFALAADKAAAEVLA